MNQKAVTNTISQLQFKGDVFTRQLIIEQRRIEDINTALRQARSEIDAYRLRTKSGAIEVLNLHRDGPMERQRPLLRRPSVDREKAIRGGGKGAGECRKTTPNPAHQRADGLDPTKQADQNQKRLVANLEARLNKLLTRHSEIVNGNEELKSQINHLRRERTTTNEVRAQFESSIAQARADISKFMVQASAAHEHREELVKTREDLIQQNRDAKERFEAKMAELTDFIEMQNERFEKSVEKATKEGRDVRRSLQITEKAGNLTIEEEEAIRAKLKEMEEIQEKEQGNDRAISEKIKWYEGAFEQLKAVSNIDDLDRLVAVFMKQEDEHFSLFNYIQAVNQETEHYLEKTEELEGEIDKYEQEQGVEEKQRVAIIRELEQRAEAQRASNDTWAVKVEEAQTMADKLAKKAQSICFKIQCDQYLQTAAKDATGERAAGLQSMASTLTGQGVTVSNIVDYMSLIEQRSMQVISNYTKKLVASDPETSLMCGPPQPPSWELPDMHGAQQGPDVSDNESDGDDVNAADKPISLSETRKEIKYRIEKKVVAMRRKLDPPR